MRERATVGERSVVGRGSAVDNDVEIRDRVRIQTGVYLTAYSLVEDDVFIGPTVSTYNDDTMARHGDDYEIRGATLRRACRIGGGAKLRPGVEVGEEAFVAMGVGRNARRAGAQAGHGDAGAGGPRRRGRGVARALALARPARFRAVRVTLLTAAKTGGRAVGGDAGSRGHTGRGASRARRERRSRASGS